MRPQHLVQIAFPVDGSTVPLPESDGPDSEGLVPLVLKAEGGALPLRWLVNGRPVSSQPYLRQTQWDPDGKGAQRVTVIDAAGKSASAEIWLK